MRLVAGFPLRRPWFERGVKSCGIYGWQSGTGVDFLRDQFPFHQFYHIHNLSSGAGTIGQLVADVPSGLSLTPPQEAKKLNYWN
jgi:hypothetical protein